MNRSHLFALLVACALCASGSPASAQRQTVATKFDRNPTPAQVLGSQHRQNVDQALRAAGSGNLTRALELLQPVVAFCDGLLDSGRLLVSAADPAQYQAYVAEAGNGEPVDWVDMACPEAYKTHAFVDVENKDVGAAFAYLDKAIRLAPYWSEPLAERGYLLNQVGKPAEGLASYRAALALAEKDQTNRATRALALRGIGYSQVELGDLEAAEQAYQQSLQIDPDSRIAKDELEYISQQRAKAPPTPVQAAQAKP